MWRECERARLSACEIEVGSIEEHPGMRDAILTERPIFDGRGTDRCCGKLVQIIVVTGLAPEGAGRNRGDLRPYSSATERI